ncbi:unnamed protein product, partial [Linum tenue]
SFSSSLVLSLRQPMHLFKDTEVIIIINFYFLAILGRAPKLQCHEACFR